MLVSHSHKFIFIKTKKTGGSTIEKIIFNNFFDPKIDICTGSRTDRVPKVNINHGSGHLGWRNVKTHVSEDQWNSYYKFTIERNPWDKVVSQYYWKTKNKPQDFSDWLTPSNNNFKTLSDWNRYAKSNPVVDQVINYNNFKSEVLSLFNNVFNLDLTEQIIDNTRTKSGYRKKHYTELYQNEDQIKMVSKRFSREIDYFDYKYGD